MRKWIGFFALLTAASGCFALEKLPETYRVRFGSDSSCAIEMTEYFSLACPKCLDLFSKDFGFYKEEYFETGKASLVLHPYPADLATLQAMVCLEKIDDGNERALFLETLLKMLQETKGELSCEMMKAGMEALGKPIPDLDKPSFLQQTEAYGHAYRFLTQEDVFNAIPTLEIDGTLIEALPTRSFVQEQIELRIK